MWARWSNLVLGVWLVLAPFILGYFEPAARANDIAVGIGLFIVALGATAVPKLRYVNTVLGAWLILAPFLLGYGDSLAPVLNDVIVGVVALGLSLVPVKRLERRRGGRRVEA